MLSYLLWIVNFLPGAIERIWTADLFLTMETLYRLSYDGVMAHLLASGPLIAIYHIIATRSLAELSPLYRIDSENSYTQKMSAILKKYFFVIGFLTLLLSVKVFAETDTFPSLRYSACADEFQTLQDTIEGYQQGHKAIEDYYADKEVYVQCHNEELAKAQELLDEWISLHTAHHYEDAIEVYEDLLDLFVQDDERIDKLIVQAYTQWWREKYEDDDFTWVLEFIEIANSYTLDDEDKFELHYLNAAALYWLERREEAEEEADIAKEMAPDKDSEALVNRLLEYIDLRLDAPTNDTIGRKQYRIAAMDIDEARKMIDKPKKVVVAIIDAWIDATHPDVKDQLRRNENEIPNNKKDDDNNWFVDDVRWWNFIARNGDMTPYGSHGTQVAWIIGALPNNQIWIAGIVDNVELMPIIICTYQDCYNSAFMDKAVRYAVDNGADIINLSLSSKSGEFLKELNPTFEYARRNWVSVVIAAGNGRPVGDKQVWINTSQHPVSPVCNESFKEMIIGVGSVDKDWHPHDRANYGRCTDVFAYGEGVVSTAMVGSEYGEYMIADGTSLAAPIVAGIIWLWFNLYGHVHPHVVYDALLASDDSFGIPHADDYLTQLWRRRLATSDLEILHQSMAKLGVVLATFSSTERQWALIHLSQLLDMLEERYRKGKNWKQLAKVYELQTFLTNLRWE